jgi:cation transport ATPase
MMVMPTQQIHLPIRGMTCASCAEKIQASLSRLDGVVHARVNYATERARVVYEPARTSAAEMVAAVRASGFDVRLDRATVPLRAVGTIAVSSRALVSARVNWQTRRIELEWLADNEEAVRAHPSLGTLFLLIRHLFRSMMHSRQT